MKSDKLSGTLSNYQVLYSNMDINDLLNLKEKEILEYQQQGKRLCEALERKLRNREKLNNLSSTDEILKMLFEE